MLALNCYPSILTNWAATSLCEVAEHVLRTVQYKVQICGLMTLTMSGSQTKWNQSPISMQSTRTSPTANPSFLSRDARTQPETYKYNNMARK